MPRRAAIAAFAILLSLYGCSTKPEASGPVLVSAEDQQRARIEPVVDNGGYSNIADRLAALAQDVYVDTNASLSELVINTGKPSHGVRLLIKGSAISDGLFAEPQVSLQGDADTGPGSGELSPAPGGDGYQINYPAVEYKKEIHLSLILPAKRGGSGDVQVFVYPADAKGKTSVIFQKNYRVLSERDDSAPTDEVPTE